MNDIVTSSAKLDARLDQLWRIHERAGRISARARKEWEAWSRRRMPAAQRRKEQPAMHDRAMRIITRMDRIKTWSLRMRRDLAGSRK